MLLAIDTATRSMSLALHDGHQLVYEHTWTTANNHTIELAPAVHRALHAYHLSAGDLAGIAVALGPGSFTGLRIGLSFAKGLAAARQTPLIAIPTLTITAAAQPYFDGDLIAVLQAGRGRICAQSFTWQEGTWRPSDGASISAWADLIAHIQRPTLFAGEIDTEGARLLESRAPVIQIAPAPQRLRRAGYLAELAWVRLHAGESDDPVSLTPVYLHQPGVPHP